jgi:hypothetical protein
MLNASGDQLSFMKRQIEQGPVVLRRRRESLVAGAMSEANDFLARHPAAKRANERSLRVVMAAGQGEQTQHEGRHRSETVVIVG